MEEKGNIYLIRRRRKNSERNQIPKLRMIRDGRSGKVARSREKVQMKKQKAKIFPCQQTTNEKT